MKFSLVIALGVHLQHLVSILSPIYWSLAKETEAALNGFSLTRGVFQQQTQVEYATG